MGEVLVEKRLYRSRNERKIRGVCGGMAKYFGMDPTAMRVIWIVGIIFGVIPIILIYLIVSLIIPLEPEEAT